ncbi:hypothetical protein MUY14_43045 [Amycolatopsis sp. FBCC-B4732]|uniref:hypothetical protein n=1 Tax=Amycolatopsis sp. FBCC-B4732 TaxID=3079339 RepID=UPI001FF2F17F|nr:hypothetical protein [Amycolatopsis sp. FBCC-B4732]UOX88389.1 hypothetical protein MUY14_43045 [Amycolatopsis sp. FBCC-B4732]
MKKLLRDLDVDTPLDVRDLCRKLADHRGRPIELVPYPLPAPGAFGLWIAFAGADRILYQQHTTTAHQDHIILHEVGHMISGHSTEGGATDLAALFPDIPAEVVRDALRRDGYSLVAEREAEMVATVIKEWATLLEALKFSPAQTSRAGRQLHGAFDDHQGWL